MTGARSTRANIPTSPPQASSAAQCVHIIALLTTMIHRREKVKVYASEHTQILQCPGIIGIVGIAFQPD